ncbi:hypothetical protein QUB75_04100 [Microcoleus sp. K1-B6]|uniref:hypothetical protein n=1 Tax=unclassified Microcoleus TaxID=2642155 RepID=UPI002FD5AD52
MAEHRKLQDISDPQANLIAGGQVTSVSQLSDVLPIDVSTEPNKNRGMLSNNFKSLGLAALSATIRALLFANSFS